MLRLWLGIGVVLPVLAAAAGSGPIELRYLGEVGELVIEAPREGLDWSASEPSTEGDLLFPDGVQLAHLRYRGEAVFNLTISFDVGQPTTAAKRAAFLDLAQEKMEQETMYLWNEGDRLWILQAFISPSERILAAQSFVGPYALACLFWMESGGDEAAQERLVRHYLRALKIDWRKEDLAAEEAGAHGHE